MNSVIQIKKTAVKLPLLISICFAAFGVTILLGQSIFRFIIQHCFLLYLGQMIVGYSLAWTGPVIPKLRELEQSPIPYLLTDAQLSLIATIVFIGGVLGPYITLWLSNVKGRKPCLIVGGILAVAGYTLLAAANNIAMIYIGRTILGAGIGTIVVSNLVYIGEMASTNIRGMLLSGIGLSHTLGSMLLFSSGPFISYAGTTYVGLALSATFTFCTLWIPETPIFYILQEKDTQLIEVLQDLGRLDDKDKLMEIKTKTETNTKVEWKELFTNSSNRKALFIVIVINIFEQSSGVLAILFFAADIFKMAGSSINWNLAMITIGFVQLIGSSITPFVVERIGRKRNLSISSLLCSLSMLTLGLYFYMDHIQSPMVKSIKWLPLVLLILYFIGYNSGLGIIPNTLIGEMFTTNVRSKGSTVTLTASWLSGFIVNTAFGAFLRVVGGHVAFWFFSCICAGALFFTIFLVPETRGKTLLEIQESL